MVFDTIKLREPNRAKLNTKLCCRSLVFRSPPPPALPAASFSSSSSTSTTGFSPSAPPSTRGTRSVPVPRRVPVPFSLFVDLAPRHRRSPQVQQSGEKGRRGQRCEEGKRDQPWARERDLPSYHLSTKRVARTVKSISPEALHREPVKLVVRRHRALIDRSRERPSCERDCRSQGDARREGDEEEDSGMASRTPRRAPPLTLTRSLGLPLIRKNSEPVNWKLPPSPSLSLSHHLSPRFPRSRSLWLLEAY